MGKKYAENGAPTCVSDSVFPKLSNRASVTEHKRRIEVSDITVVSTSNTYEVYYYYCIAWCLVKNAILRLWLLCRKRRTESEGKE